MRRRERWERLERHMDRQDALVEDIRRSVDRMEEEVRLTREEVRLSREDRKDLRVFTRDITRRMERVADAHVKAMDEMRADIVAQREAFLRLLDRFDGRGPAAAG